jgi:hypothetical protein
MLNQGRVSRCANERGQAFVELVMVLPLFLLIIAALIFFGRVLYVKIAADMPSYDACRGDRGATTWMIRRCVAGLETLKGFYINP